VDEEVNRDENGEADSNVRSKVRVNSSYSTFANDAKGVFIATQLN